MSHSTEHNQTSGPNATLFIAASETDSNLYYATKFIAPDPFIYLEVKGERLMIMSDLEVDRARHQATVDRVLSYSELERRAKSQGVKDPGNIDVIHLVLQGRRTARDSGAADVSVSPRNGCRNSGTGSVQSANRFMNGGDERRTKKFATSRRRSGQPKPPWLPARQSSSSRDSRQCALA